MRTFALALVASSLLAGCLACGNWEGAGNTMLRASSGDAILVCENGGFTAILGGGRYVEGYATEHYDGTTGEVTYSYVDGETAADVVFPGTFTVAAMDQVERDHSDVLCQDLETRAWFSAPL